MNQAILTTNGPAVAEAMAGKHEYMRVTFAGRETTNMTLDYQVSPKVGSKDLNALFACAWPDHAPIDFCPLLERALVYVCAFEDKRLVGFAKIVGDGGVHGFLLDPTVAPDRQRQGIGKSLVALCVREAKEKGLEWLHVDFVPELRPFYEACGFRPTQAGLLNLMNPSPMSRE